MSSLVGKAAADNDEFWNHSTWVEDEDGSFHESDEESDARMDTVDSDVDETEDEGGNDGEAAILVEERKQKRASNRKKMVYVASAGRELIQKRMNAVQRKKALRGDGLNAGLILEHACNKKVVWKYN